MSATGDLLSEYEDRIAQLESEVAGLKAEKWYAQHTDTMNDFVLMGMARDDAEERLTAMTANAEALALSIRTCGADEVSMGCYNALAAHAKLMESGRV